MAAVLQECRTESSRSLLELLDESPLLLDFPSPFWMLLLPQTLDDASRIREQIEAQGTRPVLCISARPMIKEEAD